MRAPALGVACARSLGSRMHRKNACARSWGSRICRKYACARSWGSRICRKYACVPSWGSRICRKSSSGGFLGPFCGLGLEMPQNGLLEASWAHSAAWAWKCSKMTFWRLPGLILRLGLGNAPKWLSGGFLNPFCGLGLEMLQNGFLEASWAHSAA